MDAEDLVKIIEDEFKMPLENKADLKRIRNFGDESYTRHVFDRLLDILEKYLS